MAKNGISTLQYKADRQLAKLQLAETKRQLVGTAGYRPLRYLDITELPTVYAPNDNNSYNRIDNPNTGGLVIGRPWTAGAPPSSGNDFGFTGDQNMWIINGGYNAGSTFSSPPPTNPAYTYPDNSYTGKTYNFTGTQWMSSMNLKVNNSWTATITTAPITIDFWFYPTANSVQLLSESDHADVTSGYHYSMLEIDSSGYVHARFYNGTYPTSAIVSSNTVELNNWNHIWFQETATGNHNFTLNNVAVTGNANYTRIPPNTAEYFLIGTSDATALTTYGRFQGKIGYLNIHDYAVASTWTNTKARFRPTTYSVSIRSYNSGTNTPGNVITTCNEGDTIYIQIDWTSLTVPGGLDSYLQLGGANITDQDITVMGPVNATDPIPFGSDTGYIVSSGGTTGAPILINADSTTEGNETLTWKWYVNGSVVASASCTIVDTSQDPPGPSFNQVISLNPNYIVTNGGTSIPNDADEGSTSATVAGTFTSSPAQGGTLTFNSGDSRILLPAKNIKTIGMWIKLINPGVHNPAYLLDSRLHDVFLAGSGSGYFYSGGIEDWTLMSINGAPADNSSWASLVSNVNVWQYVTVISQTTKTDSITLFNRYTPNESLVEFQVGRIEAWDYIQLDSQIAAAYASHSSNYV